MKNWLLVLLVTLVATACEKPAEAPTSGDAAPSAATAAEAPKPFTRISGADAKQLVAKGAKLIDVRTPQEFNSGHIDGAINIPVQELSSRMAELDKAQPTVVYCASGARSGSAMGMMKDAGFAQVYNGGGIGNMR
jgi:phage shock protein E